MSWPNTQFETHAHPAYSQYASYQGYWQPGSEWQDPAWAAQAQAQASEWQQQQSQSASDWQSVQNQNPSYQSQNPYQNFEAPPPPPPELPGPPPKSSSSIARTPPPPVLKPTPVAYTSVVQKPPATSNQDSSGKNAWPDSLRKYVERAFSAPSSDKRKLQTALTEIINLARAEGDLWNRDWENFPLPLSESPDSRESTGISFSIQKSLVIRDTSPFNSRQNRKRSRSSSPDSPTPTTNISPAKLRKMEKKFGKQMQQGKNKKQQMGKNSAKQQSQNQNQKKKAAWKMPDLDFGKQSERAQRFGDGAALGAVQLDSNRQANFYGSARFDFVENNAAIREGPAVRGTCQNLEKSYFRLTSKPDPSVVRPAPVLKQALERLVSRIQAGDKRCNYIYAADQFKGMRQDCTVQHIRTELSAQIYEAHARCALENGDLGEYNQCQSQLEQHYEAGITSCRDEFKAYQVLYQTVNTGKGERAALLVCLQSLRPEDFQHPNIAHALKVRQAASLGDFVQVCQLYSSTEYMGQALLDGFMSKVRLTGLKVLLKSCTPSLPVKFVAERLGFVSPLPANGMVEKDSVSLLPGCSRLYRGRHYEEGNIAEGVQSCLDWLQACGAVIIALQGVPDEFAVETKSSMPNLHLPVELKPAGPDLAIDDFLSQTLSTP